MLILGQHSFIKFVESTMYCKIETFLVDQVFEKKGREFDEIPPINQSFKLSHTKKKNKKIKLP